MRTKKAKRGRPKGSKNKPKKSAKKVTKSTRKSAKSAPKKTVKRGRPKSAKKSDVLEQKNAPVPEPAAEYQDDDVEGCPVTDDGDDSDA